MVKVSLIEIFREIAHILEIQGENPFAIRAYHNAIRVLEGLNEDISDIVKRGELRSLPGIGEGLSRTITEYVKTHKILYHIELKKSFPEGLLEMLRIRGLGPKKVKVLWEALEITTVGELEYACKENRLIDLDGFGAKTQEKILRGIDYLKKTQGLFLISMALDPAERLLKKLRAHAGVQRVSLAGSLRRCKEIIKDIDIVVSTKHPQRVMKYFVELKEAKGVIAYGQTKSSITLDNGINVDLRAVSDREFPYAVHHMTGSKEHNTAMRQLAKRAGYKMNEYGLFKGKRLVPCKNEKEIFSKLGLAFIEPELRENMGEIEAASKARLPKLVQQGNLRGIFHAHTTYSDGAASLLEMAEAAERLGYEYIGISDHSKSAHYANGLKEDRIKKQHQEIDRLNKSLRKIQILKGIECDILPSGAMDYPDEVLASFDFVIASVHSLLFGMTEIQMTRRIIRAIQNRYVNMLGHVTGRLLLGRDAYPVNLPKVIHAAVEEGVVIEVNANPHRLDLDWRLLKKAKEEGLKVSINPDAHNPGGLTDTSYGVGIARKGWLEAEDVVNTLSRKEVVKFLRGQRDRAKKS
jgi:DNA polymerase (family X)